MAKATQDVIVRIKVDGAGNAKVQIDQLGKSFLDAEVAARKMSDMIDDGSKIAEGSVGHYRRMIAAMKVVRDNSAKTAEDFQRQTLAIEKLQIEMREITSATSSYNKVNEDQISNAGLAGATLTELGRTISDMPYGIRGVANNLSQLSTLFITLMSKTKGFTNTIRLLKAELSGPLGLIIGFQAVISLLDFFSQKTSEAKDKSEEFTESVGEELIVLRQLNVALKENKVAREAAVEIIKDTLKNNKELEKVLNDTTLSEEESIEATIKLSEERQKQLELEHEIGKTKQELAKNEADTKTVLNDITTKTNELNQIDINNTVLRTIKQDELNALGLKRNELEQSHIDLLLRLRDLIVGRNELDAENLENKEKEIKVGTIEYYQKLIKELREQQKNVATTANEYDNLQRRIDIFKGKIEDLTDAYRELNGEVVVGVKGLQDFGMLITPEEQETEFQREAREELEKGTAARKKDTTEFLNAAIKRLGVTETTTKASIKLSDEEQKAKTRNLLLISNSLGLAQNAFAEGTAANKALGVANATIDTYAAADAILNPTKGGGLPFPLNIVAAAAVITAGLANVKQILSVKVPGGKGGGVSTPSAATGGAPQIQAPDFNVVGATAQSQLAETIAGAEARPTRAYVVGKDITTQQELDRNITNTASFG